MSELYRSIQNRYENGLLQESTAALQIILHSERPKWRELVELYVGSGHEALEVVNRAETIFENQRRYQNESPLHHHALYQHLCLLNHPPGSRPK